nr:hypothetical protein [uncultured Campylobacter sp.]
MRYCGAVATKICAATTHYANARTNYGASGRTWRIAHDFDLKISSCFYA